MLRYRLMKPLLGLEEHHHELGHSATYPRSKSALMMICQKDQPRLSRILFFNPACWYMVFCRIMTFRHDIVACYLFLAAVHAPKDVSSTSPNNRQLPECHLSAACYALICFSNMEYANAAGSFCKHLCH